MTATGASASEKSIGTATADRETLVAVRGQTGLSQDDLRAHMAGLLQLPNVGVLLGAGASVSAGGSTMLQLRPTLDLIRKPRAQGVKTGLADALVGVDDVEHAWTRLQRIVDLPSTEVLIDAGTLKEAREALHKLTGALIAAAELRGHPAGQPAADGPPFATHRQLLLKLLASRDPGQPPPWIFTSNYDLAVEQAAEALGVHVINGFTGLHARRFDPRCLDLGLYSRDARGEARFGASYFCLAKLHGSLNWFQAGDEIVEVPLAEAWRRIKGDESDAERPVLIPPSSAKYHDTIGFVQGELFRRFAEFVQQPNSVLLVNGYSMSDRHLDRLLLSGLLNPTFHLVLCCYEGKVSGPKDAATFAAPSAASSRLCHVMEAQHPCVTLVGGAKDGPADFSTFTSLIPDAAMLDREHRMMQQLARRLLESLPKDGPSEPDK